jgi:hypothetical protein
VAFVAPGGAAYNMCTRCFNVQAWHNLEGLLNARYPAAEEVVTAISRSGLRGDQLGSDVLRYPLGALWELSRDPTGQSKEFEASMRLVEQNGPPGTQ